MLTSLIILAGLGYPAYQCTDFPPLVSNNACETVCICNSLVKCEWMVFCRPAFNTQEKSRKTYNERYFND